jgi:hypothetical protein
MNRTRPFRHFLPLPSNRARHKTYKILSSACRQLLLHPSSSTDQLGHVTLNQSSGWQIFQDPQNGFTIQYPPDWREDEPVTDPTPNLALFITPDDESTPIDTRTDVIVEVENISKTLDPTTL